MQLSLVLGEPSTAPVASPVPEISLVHRDATMPVEESVEVTVPVIPTQQNLNPLPVTSTPTKPASARNDIDLTTQQEIANSQTVTLLTLPWDVSGIESLPVEEVSVQVRMTIFSPC